MVSQPGACRYAANAALFPFGNDALYQFDRDAKAFLEKEYRRRQEFQSEAAQESEKYISGFAQE